MNSEVLKLLGYKIKDAEEVLIEKGINYKIKETKAPIRKDFVKDAEKRILRIKKDENNNIELIIG
jgi:hypothetical protein